MSGSPQRPGSPDSHLAYVHLLEKTKWGSTNQGLARSSGSGEILNHVFSLTLKQGQRAELLPEVKLHLKMGAEDC